MEAIEMEQTTDDAVSDGARLRAIIQALKARMEGAQTAFYRWSPDGGRLNIRSTIDGISREAIEAADVWDDVEVRRDKADDIYTTWATVRVAGMSILVISKPYRGRVVAVTHE